MKNEFRFKVLQAIARVTRKFHPRGTNRLLTQIYNPNRRMFDHFTLVMEYDGHLSINIDTADFLEWLIFFYGYHEPELVRQIKRLFRPGFVAFDIGASMGCHTLIMSDRAGKDGMVFAAEPNPSAYKRLVENIRLNQLSNIKAFSCAFSDVSIRGKLFVPVEGTANTGVASLYRANVNYPVVEVPIEVKILDEFIGERDFKRLDFIKIDTEGNELKVLQGALSSIVEFQPWIVFEYSKRSWSNSRSEFSDAEKYLANLDYSLYVIGLHSLTRVDSNLPPTANILAIPFARTKGPERFTAGRESKSGS